MFSFVHLSAIQSSKNQITDINLLEKYATLLNPLKEVEGFNELEKFIKQRSVYSEHENEIASEIISLYDLHTSGNILSKITTKGIKQPEALLEIENQQALIETCYISNFPDRNETWKFWVTTIYETIINKLIKEFTNKNFVITVFSDKPLTRPSKQKSKSERKRLDEFANTCLSFIKAYNLESKFQYESQLGVIYNICISSPENVRVKKLDDGYHVYVQRNEIKSLSISVFDKQNNCRADYFKPVPVFDKILRKLDEKSEQHTEKYKDWINLLYFIVQSRPGEIAFFDLDLLQKKVNSKTKTVLILRQKLDLKDKAMIFKSRDIKDLNIKVH